MDKEIEIPICDLCGEKSDFQFRITKNAEFFACSKHAKQLSDIIYPIGDQIGAIRLKKIMSELSTKKSLNNGNP